MNFNANLIPVVHYFCRQYRMKFQFLNTNRSFRILCKNRSNIHFGYTLHIFHRKLARRNLQSVNQLANFSNHQPIYKRNPDTFSDCFLAANNFRQPQVIFVLAILLSSRHLLKYFISIIAKEGLQKFLN